MGKTLGSHPHPSQGGQSRKVFAEPDGCSQSSVSENISRRGVEGESVEGKSSPATEDCTFERYGKQKLFKNLVEHHKE